jgi:hypothetical protein
LVTISKYQPDPVEKYYQQRDEEMKRRRKERRGGRTKSQNSIFCQELVSIEN